MKKKRYCRTLCAVLLLGILAFTSACGSKKDKAQEGQTDAAVTEAPVQEAEKTSDAAAAAASTSEAEQAAAPASGGAVEETPADAAAAPADAEGTQEAAAAPQPAAGTQAGLPQVTEQPTDESLTEGYSCMYIASADNADKMMWHAVSPDGKDIPFSEIGEYFPYMECSGETTEVLSLFNVASGFNGWGSYCRFENSAGSTDSAVAVTHVKRIETDEKPKNTTQQNTTQQNTAQQDTAQQDTAQQNTPLQSAAPGEGAAGNAEAE